MLQRPRVGETEEDLFKQEEEFLRKSGKVQTRKRNIVVNAHETKTFKVPGVVGEVVERNQGLLIMPSHGSDAGQKGFPPLFEIDPKISSCKRGRKSLFALQMERNKTTSDDMAMEVDVPVLSAEETETNEECGMNREDIPNIPGSVGNYCLSDDVKESIHKESLKKLSAMSEAEILEAQRKLYETLDPKLISLLKNRSKSGEKSKIKKEPQPQEVEMGDSSNMYEEGKIKETLSDYVGEKWVNMDFIEKEKLEWVGDIPNAKSLEPDKPYSARFDFRGELQPFSTEINVTNALYHHGDEPERPGYTIQELYQLSRSSVLQQRILALNTLAVIIQKTKLGYYDVCFDGYLLHKLIESDLFLLLRFSIDENTLIPAAINCLRRLLCNDSDEYCLDRLLGVTNEDVQPLLFDKIEADKNEERELKDNTIIHCDLIKGVLRTDLLLRITYILNNLPCDRETVGNAILCFIRISRHSIESCEEILNKPDLLNFVYSCINCANPIHHGVKLFRLLIGQSKDLAAHIASRYDMGFLVSLLDLESMSEIPKRELYLLKLEAIYLWRNFVRFGFMVDDFISWTPCFIRLLRFYVEKVNICGECDFDFEMFSALMSLLRVCVRERHPIDTNYLATMYICLEKWMKQLLHFQTFNYGGMKALGSCFAFFVDYFAVFEIDQISLSFIRKLNGIISSVIGSSGFDCMASRLLDNSHILVAAAIKRDPSNLPSLCSVYENGDDFLRIVNNRSTLPFFIPLLKYLKSVYHVLHESKNNVELFLSCPALRGYVTEVIKLNRNSGNWFERYELALLTDILELSCITNDEFSLKLGFRLMPMIRVDDVNLKRVLTIVTDKKNWFCNEELFNCLPDIYLEHLYKPEAENNFVLRYRNEAVGEDWAYKILSLLRGKEAVAEVGKVLRFVSLISERDPQLLERIPYAVRYYHLCSVFLTDENVFDDEIRAEMRSNFGCILCNREKVNLDKKVDKKKSFYDLYTELITQYAGVSYGLHIFAEYVLFPLQNRFDISFRKLLWFEYLHVLRVITLPYPATDFVDVKDFVEPCETDESLLVAYLNSVSNNVISKHRNPFVYNIAVSNVKNYMKSVKNDTKLFNFLSEKISSIKNEKMRQDLTS